MVPGEAAMTGWFGTGAAAPSSGAVAGDAGTVRRNNRLPVGSGFDSESPDDAEIRAELCPAPGRHLPIPAPCAARG